MDDEPTDVIVPDRLIQSQEWFGVAWNGRSRRFCLDQGKPLVTQVQKEIHLQALAVAEIVKSLAMPRVDLVLW